MIKHLLSKLITSPENFTPEDAHSCLDYILSSQASDAQTSAFLLALKFTGLESNPKYVASLAVSLLSNATHVHTSKSLNTVDIVGTGGDGQNTFNVSTCAAIVCAGAGCKIAKHGNRASSSSCGSADVLEKMGCKLSNIDATKLNDYYSNSNFAFLFAQQFHPSMKHVSRIRKEIGVSTVFNILGPLINPLKPERMVVGVYSRDLGIIMANTLHLLGVKRAWVVHGLVRLDEISPQGKTVVWELDESGRVNEKIISSEDFGLPEGSLDAVRGGDAEENAKIMTQILNNELSGDILNYVLMNASAVLYVAGMANSLKEGVEIARKSISSGRASKQASEMTTSTTQEQLETVEPVFNGPLSIPVFYPSMEEFKDFNRYLKHVEPFGHQYGLVKIVPPDEWKDKIVAPAVSNLSKYHINNPIKQEFNNGGLPSGVYRQLNVESKKSYTAQEWLQLSMQTAPIFDDYGKLHQPSSSTPPAEKKVSVSEFSKKLQSSSYGFTPEHCKELERYYWKNLGFFPPLYGADMLGSLFDYKQDNPWNLGALKNVLSRISVPIPGVNTPYLYFGHWKATFAWHLEDVDLFSINYIHFGAPKQWYVIPPSSKSRFEVVSKSFFFDESKECPEYLRHKTCVISPSVLANNAINVHRVVQHAGEFMITFPMAYHQGFNFGFNVAESVNFALESWIELGKRAKYCKCIGDSVRLDVSVFGNENSDDLKDEESFDARGWIETLRENQNSQKMNKPSKKPAKKPPAAVKTLEIDELKKCVLCISSQGEMIETELGKPCHKICASMIPETDVIQDPNNPDKEIAIGIENVPRDRWNLKCDICKVKSTGGKNLAACIQCVRGKCVRSFHVTCAESNGITLLDDDGNHACYCPTHDEKKRAIKRKELDIAFNQNAISLYPPGTFVAARCGSYTYEGVVMEIIPEKKSCLVSFKIGNPSLVSWSQLKCIESPSFHTDKKVCREVDLLVETPSSQTSCDVIVTDNLDL